MIPFSKPYLAGCERTTLEKSLSTAHWSGDGPFSRECCRILREMTGSPVFMTASATQALELALMALSLEPGDEVILPSYTFVSTANAAVLNGLRPVFVDIREDTLNIDETLIEGAITRKTRAILPVHYAGVAAEMESLSAIAKRHRLAVVEDAAQAVHAFYRKRPLGTFGDMGVFSFHQTKNFTCGEGGAIVVNNPDLMNRIEIHRQKGTDRSRFLKGDVDKYSWVDRGSSYVLSDLLAAFLAPQLEAREEITRLRKGVYERYLEGLSFGAGGRFRLPAIPASCEPNYHIFYIRLENETTRDRLKAHLKDKGIETASHFVPLHDSRGGKKFGTVGSRMEVTTRVASTLLRLPLYPGLSHREQQDVIRAVEGFFA